MKIYLRSILLLVLCSLFSQAFASDYNYFDPKNEINPKILKNAVNYFIANNSKIKNKKTLAIIDFTLHSSKDRLFLIDVDSGKVDGYLVSHGKGSDPDHDGIASKFSNKPDSLMSSLGFYVGAETYSGKHGYSLRLDGLSTTNSNARDREIVVHAADYVEYGTEKIGRSWGCPSIDPRTSREVINRLKGGTLIYAGHKE